MNAEEYLREGNLPEALSALERQVRSSPSDPKIRIFLFQVLCIMGQWDRAVTQLNVVGEMDESALAMVHAYRDVIKCEALRASVFVGTRHPLVFGEPERWIALLLEALRLQGKGESDKAGQLREQAFAAAPVSSGTVDGREFEWIADADTRIGPCLEAIVNGNYYWIPFRRISEIRCGAPEDLRDFCWSPAQFKWANGGEAVGFIPTRYPGTETQEDDVLRLARKTEWRESDDGTYAGLGQRMLATNEGEYSLLEIRSISLHSGNGAA